MLTSSHPVSIQAREPYLYVFLKINAGLYSDIYRLISSRLADDGDH